MSDFLSLYDESDDFQPSKEESSPLCEQLAQVTDAYSREELIAKGGYRRASVKSTVKGLTVTLLKPP